MQTQARKLTSFDIKFLTKDLNEKLKNARIQKIFSFTKDKKKKHETEIHLLLHIPKQGTHRLTIGSDRFFLTKKPVIHDENSSNFALYLRKYLKSKKIITLKQHNFDRVVIIEFENNFLVCEIFGKGNILFLDKSEKILGLLTNKIWKQRILKRGEKYIYPPKSKNIFDLELNEFETLLKRNSKKIIVFLSENLCLGSQYANIICNLANIEKTCICCKLEKTQLKSIFLQIRNLINSKEHPFVVEMQDKNQNKVITDYYPVDVSFIEKKRYCKNFIEATELYYVQEYKRLEETKQQTTKNKSIEKEKRILENQRKNKEKIEAKINKINSIINIIIQNYEKLEIILKQIAEKNKADNDRKIIENIDLKTKEVLFNINETKFKLSLNKTIEQNLFFYYDERRKNKEKLKRLEIIQKHQLKKASIENLKILKQAKTNPEEKKQWYERFHWFFTANKLLAIGGKNAKQNEEVIKKYAKDNDLIFHCDIAGSPFVVLKSSVYKENIKKTDLDETAVFTAVYSRAWKIGVGAIDVYWVQKNQVTKKAPSGQYIGTGSFMIYGKKNIITAVLEFAIGFVFDKLIFGPVGAIQSQTNKYVVIEPGDICKEKLAKQIKQELGKKLNKAELQKFNQINVNLIQNNIPQSKGELKKI